LLVRLPVEVEPLVGSLPLQPPEAMQDVAWVEFQLNVALAPLATVLGFAVKMTVGTGCVTDTVADCDASPPVPVQASVKVALAFRVPVDCVPLTGFAPLQPPLALQEVVFDEDQVKVEALPASTTLGFALIVTAGAAFHTVMVAAWVALPPGPVQVRI
jgi:hypothetical protein